MPLEFLDSNDFGPNCQSKITYPANKPPNAEITLTERAILISFYMLILPIFSFLRNL